MNECWVWTGTRQSQGYGILYVEGEPVLAHRFAWAFENGPVPEGIQVLHHCDNPPCTRPSHLFLGTQKDNMQDMANKGRGRKSTNKTHCPQGHAYTEENIYHYKGWRSCRTCRTQVSKAQVRDCKQEYQRYLEIRASTCV
ncbi:hypothetical protein LCGC14_1783330 [marine sediment metagenome]|uniref:HNH nuclease domain-containing protein n=1 Tax=marine sediment metagenome TaxID=412755 RepID=A0A0F9HHA9_9ZZZZ